MHADYNNQFVSDTAHTNAARSSCRSMHMIKVRLSPRLQPHFLFKLHMFYFRQYLQLCNSHIRAHLTPADFWLWGYLKSRVYCDDLTKCHELKKSIRPKVFFIPPDMPRAAVWNVWSRLRIMTSTKGKSIEQLL